MEIRYETYPGWATELDDVKTFDELPSPARAFISGLEQYLGVPFTMISTGPEREKLIVR
jgi:adenylosuccinate synthase